MSSEIVLSLFDYTGNMVKPWARNGYECYCLDIKHNGEERTEQVGEGEINYIGGDIHEFLPPKGEYRFVFAFPPCTNLAVSGARWFKDKGLEGLGDAIKNFDKARDICEWSESTWLIENPVSTISTYWREPDWSFHPYEYDGYTEKDTAYQKRTCLWTSDDFLMPNIKPAKEWDERIHQKSPSENRSEWRSVTPMGFAEAVYEANEVEDLLQE